MADAGGPTANVDLASLSADQQSALDQYTAVTAQDVAEAIPLLQRSQWNVQIAISKFFDGEGPDPVADAMASQPHVPQQASRLENLQDSFGDDYVPFGRPQPTRPDPAPRIVPQPRNPPATRPPLLLGLLLAPFNLGYRALHTTVRLVLYVFAMLPSSLRPRAITNSVTAGWRGTMGRRMLLPRDTASRFRREFEEEYGDSPSLPFHEAGFAQALDLAKKELKFLLMILVSPEHDDTDSFTRHTLLSPEVSAFLNDPANNIILWGGNVLDSEAYQIAAEYNCTKFPFSCLICLTPKEGSTRMGIAKRLVGPLAPVDYLAEIQAAIAKYAPDLAAARAERDAHQVSRNLRDEQDSAYERSLAIDRERARQRREASAAAAAAEQKAREDAAAAELAAQQRQQWRRWRATTLSAEPPADADPKSVVRLALNLPTTSSSATARRVVRRFASDTTLEELYAFVECHDLLSSEPENTDIDEKPPTNPEADGCYKHEYRFRVASPMPRVVYEPWSKATLGERIGRSGNLIVEEVEDGDQDMTEENET